jgi:hypothetical protein
MPDGLPLSRLYRVIAVFVFFAVVYGLLGLTPGPVMTLCFLFGPSLAVAGWLAADTRRTHVAAVYDAGWLFALSWPFVVPWYALRTRGRAGWWLAAQLYSSVLAVPLGLAWGRVLRWALQTWVRYAA